MKVLIAVCGLLASLAVLSIIPVNDSGPALNGGFSVWAQTRPAQPPEGCHCTNPKTNTTSCMQSVYCIQLGWQCSGAACEPGPAAR
jgi:hypothetical protein